MIFLFLFISSILFNYVIACEPDQTFIREQYINTYPKKDGTIINGHIRKAHCRTVELTNYFQNNSSQKFIGIKPMLKPWKPAEKKIVETYLDRIPPWLKKYSIREILRANTKENPQNPAASVALTRTLLILDPFFTASNKIDIIVHELAHLAILDFSAVELTHFYEKAGWTRNKITNERIPPTHLLLEDSKGSISEDFANHIEVYHGNPERLRSFNPSVFHFLDELIKKRSL